MNKIQRFILFVAAGVTFLMLLFPPTNIVSLRVNRPVYQHYNLLFDLGGTVNAGMLIAQFIAVLTITGLLWFAMSDKT